MAKKKKQKKSVKKASPLTAPKKSLFERIDSYLEKRQNPISVIITFIALIMSFMMFDAKVSTGLDDSTYVIQGWEYSKDFFGHFFTSQAPFYAMFLALPIKFLGINLEVLKVINVLFFVGSVYILYRAFRNRISWLILFSALLIYATNTEALRMASLTYAEALFLLIQSIFIYVSIRLIEKLDNSLPFGDIIKKNGISILVMAVCFYLLFFTRTVGIAAIVVYGVYFLIRKQYKLMVLVPGIMAAIYMLFEFAKTTIWDVGDQFSKQGRILWQKDAYDASQGYEDVNGMLTRMLENTNQYFSSRLFEILGFRDYLSEWNWSLTIVVLVFLIMALVRFSKNKKQTELFTVLYTGAICGFTFLALQTSWGQHRYMMIILPFIIISVFGLFFNWFSSEKAKPYQFLAILIIGIVVISNLTTGVKRAQKHIPILKANVFGDEPFKGLTTDWVNYLEMSKYCFDSLEEDALVACRKSFMSSVVTKGNEFFPIWRTLPNPDPDSTLNVFKEKGVTHVIVAKLRVNAKTSTGGTINTVSRVLQPIDKKYPGKLELVHTIGTTEEARLFKINY